MKTAFWRLPTHHRGGLCGLDIGPVTNGAHHELIVYIDMNSSRSVMAKRGLPRDAAGTRPA
ncbi:hypothetical protein GCM10017674_76720 [Streptomyces gardneri]|uniref:Uncharacterized protein n=1 Tax=Streptomyces gardneri TaxID=66892 RepID=A0A4Y3RS12_9ACTN|nr:hypothetical protein SGA01_58300 [Streptomyces gardneri]GHH21709.1 hypothetical protein GCM10017674_76720 [Streptomyces gardneri]